MATGSKKIDDFGALKKEVKKAIAQQREQQAQQRRKQEEQQSDHDLFMQAVSGVTPLNAPQTVSMHKPTPKPIPIKHQDDQKDNLCMALSDGISVDSLIDEEDTINYAQNGVGPEVLRKLKRGVWPIEDEIDLHGMRRDEAREMVVSFLHHANTQRMRCIRIIHGKGFGSVNNEPVLKKLVQRWLVQRLDVIAFTQANPEDGGSGAVIVLLKGRNS